MESKDRTILTYRGFLFENSQANIQAISLDDAIAIAEKGKKTPKSFIEFLKSDFARRFSEDPYVLISTPTQLRRGTFMFTMKGSTRDIAIALFQNAYVRTVPYGQSKQTQSHVLVSPSDLLDFEGIEITVKSSMTQQDFEELRSIDTYGLMSKFIEQKLDVEAAAEEFPKLRRVSKAKKTIKRLTIVDRQGRSMGAYATKTGPKMIYSKEDNPIDVDITLKTERLDGCFFDPKTFNSLTLNAYGCSMVGSEIGGISLNAAFRSNSKIDGSSLVIPAGSMSGGWIIIEDSSAVGVNIKKGSGHSLMFTAQGSNLDDLSIDIGDSKGSIRIVNSSVKGFKFSGRRENLMMDWRYIMNLHLQGIKISDSKDLERLVLEGLMQGPSSIKQPYYENFVLLDCDFEGVDFSRLSLDNWDNQFDMLEVMKLNKNLKIGESNPGIDQKLKRIIKTRGLFNR